MDRALASSLWDAEYRKGRYSEEPPVPFVDRIIATLEADPAWQSRGLYVGCGNGRNFLPLVESGLELHGLDLSGESLRQLEARHPTLSTSLIRADFRDFHSPRQFGYLIAIQAFQHGTCADVAAYFAKVKSLLAPGGLFFLRVNAVSTQIHLPHTVIEANELGGVTILYESGPKDGLPIHFYTRDELLELTRYDFDVVAELREDVTLRTPPETGYWVQWEGIWRRRHIE